MTIRLDIANVARRQKGWSMTRLAEEMDIDPQAVMNWNQGVCFPRLPRLWKVAKILGVTMDELILEEE